MIKWITAILGYTYFRFGGAILGYFIGSILEQLFRQDRRNPFSSVQSQRMQTNQVQLNLLSLAAIIIKADGKANSGTLSKVINVMREVGIKRAAIVTKTINVSN